VALDYPEDTALASRYVKQALPLMIKHKIAPNPCNFALWYNYVAKRDNGLNAALDSAIARRGTCPEALSQVLFKKHIIREEMALQQQLRQSLNQLVQQLADNIDDTKNGADDVSQRLQQSLDALHRDSDPVQLQRTLEQLIETTQSANQMADNFQQQLHSARSEINTLKQQLDQKEQDSYLDALTKIGNRRAFDKRLVELFQRQTAAVTLILIDLDHFKALNDNYGHLIGDRVLQAVAEILQRACPEGALAARYGGEEFAFLLEDSAATAAVLAEKTRQLLSQLLLRNKHSDEVIENVTASFGIAERGEGEHPEQLIERADRALYAAKQGGRDRIEVAEHSALPA